MAATLATGAERRYRFFAGKGGVGKTTCAAAAALRAAERGARVLVASTDPAHSLGDAFDCVLGPDPLQVPTRVTRSGGLWAVEISGERAFSRWLGERREALRTAALRGTYLEGEDVDRLLALTPPGIDEIASLLAVERAARETGCGEVVVDMAPTAHALRLLATPEVLARIAALLDDLQEKHRLLARSFGGAYRPDFVDVALADLEAEARGLGRGLADPGRTRFAWVLLPEALSLAEARDGVAALAREGIAVEEVVVNRVTSRDDERSREERKVIAETAVAFPGVQLGLLPDFDREPRGTTALRRVARALVAAPSRGGSGGRGGVGGVVELALRAQTPLRGASTRAPSSPDPVPRPTPRRRPHRRSTWPALLAPPEARLLFFGGKGGVGKTTCAATAALLLAKERPGARLLLLSTDPAHSLGDVLGVPLSDAARLLPKGPPNLWARELDTEHALERWSGERRAAIEGLLDTFFGAPGAPERGAARGAIAERFAGVTPGGLDELMAVVTLAAVVSGEGEEAFDLVIVDLAPTGHALRLLEMPALALAWDRAFLAILLKYRAAVHPGALAEELVELSRTLSGFAELLADPRRTRFVPVARTGELPRRETERLIAALARLGIAPAALVINTVEPEGGEGERAVAPKRDQRSVAPKRDQRSVARLAALARGRSAILLAPALYPPPRGLRALAAWGRSWQEGATS
jgi:arsenite/tail-anchored protein-transporting ATPase